MFHGINKGILVLIGIAAVLTVGIIGLSVWVFGSESSAPPSENGDDEKVVVNGRVLEVTPDGQLVVLKTERHNEFFVTLTTDTLVYNAEGEQISATDLQPGFRVRVKGKRTDGESFAASTVYVSEKAALIIAQPGRDEVVSGRLRVQGQIQQKGATGHRLQYRITKEDGTELVSSVKQVGTSTDAEYVPFTHTVFLPVQQLEDNTELKLTIETLSLKTRNRKITLPLLFRSQNALSVYKNTPLRVALSYPSLWAAERSYGTIQDTPLRYSGPEGFFAVNVAGDATVDLESVAEKEAFQQREPYGSEPAITSLTVAGRSARLIMPSDDQAERFREQAAIIVPFTTPIEVKGNIYGYLLLRSNQQYLRTIASTLTFLKPSEVTFQVYYSNFQRDPEERCDVVFPVERVVQRRPPVERQALEELVAGPTTQENEEGYFTNIPADFLVNRVAVDNGTATVAYSMPEEAIANECQRQAVRSQVRETIVQFPHVDAVRIETNNSS